LIKNQKPKNNPQSEAGEKGREGERESGKKEEKRRREGKGRGWANR
jgi:hypothetical protein